VVKGDHSISVKLGATRKDKRREKNRKNGERIEKGSVRIAPQST
jgi:hypothetical protein